MKILDKNGIKYSEEEIPSELEEYYDHYAECYKRCMLLESTLTSLESATNQSYFPVIIGKRPVSPLNESNTVLQGKENVSRGPNSPPIVSLYIII